MPPPDLLICDVHPDLVPDHKTHKVMDMTKMLTGGLGRALALSVSILAVSGPAAWAQPAASADNFEVRLYPGVAPGSEIAKQEEVKEGPRIRNVTVPTLTVFRPKAGTATDAAVIVAPGGGFARLFIDGEGYDIAKRLADHGITAIVLKYRTSETPAAGVPERPRPAAPADQNKPVTRRDPNNGTGAHQAVADSLAAVRFVRAHADAWHIAPQRVGFLGFSAGAFLAMQLATEQDADSRPDFAGAIYSPRPAGMVVPADAPPLFLAVATDDEAVGASPSLQIFRDWQAAGRSAEMHVYESGRHGFAWRPQQKTTDHWMDAYLWWLHAPNGAVRLPEPPGVSAQ
jgi:acetyl esterase/lipase